MKRKQLILISVLFLLVLNIVNAQPAEDHWWRFENDYTDSAGDWDLTAGGTPSFVTGKVDTYAVQFDGSDWARLTDGYSGTDQLTSMSVSMWIRYTSSHTGLNLWIGGESNMFINSYPSSSHHEARVWADSATQYKATSTGTDNVGSWYHLVIIAEEGEKVKLYVNGSGNLWQSGSALTDFDDPDAIINICYDDHSAQCSGVLQQDDLRIFNNTVLTTDEIDWLYNDHGGTNESLSGFGGDLPPEIDFYNMTSDGGAGCIKWNDDKSDACDTSDTTPTVFINTSMNAFCAIGVSDLNYTGLGISRQCDGGGGIEHTCTLTPKDELTEEISDIYIGCQSTLGVENSSSTSGALRVSIHSSDLESSGRNSIETAAQHALTSGYTIYTDQKVYARNSANQQTVGVFDKVVKWLNKIWAFNVITGNETYVNMFNITPVLYTLEINTTTNSSVNTTAYQFMMDTK